MLFLGYFMCRPCLAICLVFVSESNQLVDPTTSDFASLAKIGALVDKSSALEDFLKPRTPIHLLLRPRRSGKTTLLNMFR